ncbi:hypothetical protein LIER_18898 [Lithospermum erythrorhizon]
MMGLNEDFEATRNQVLLMEPLPSIAKAYSMFSDIEKQRSIQNVMNESLNNFVMQVKTGFGNMRRGAHIDKSLLKCDFYGKKGHVKSGCFKIKGLLEIRVY